MHRAPRTAEGRPNRAEPAALPRPSRRRPAASSPPAFPSCRRLQQDKEEADKKGKLGSGQLGSGVFAGGSGGFGTSRSGDHLDQDIDAEAIRGVAKAMAGLANGGGAGGTMVVHDADSGGGGGGFGTMVVNGDAAPGGSGGSGSMVVNPASASPSGASAVPAFIRQLVTGKAEQSSPANVTPRLDASRSPRAPPARGDAGGRCAGCSSASASAPSEREKSTSARQQRRDNNGHTDKGNKYDCSHMGAARPPARARARAPLPPAREPPTMLCRAARTQQPCRTLQAPHADVPAPRCALQAWTRSTRSLRVSRPTWNETWPSLGGNVRGRAASNAALEPCAGSTRRMPSPPPHPTHPPARPRAPCRRQAGAGAACGEGAQDRRRGAARFDAVTLRARRDATGPRAFALRGRPSCVQPRCRSSLGTRPLVARRGQAVRRIRTWGPLCVRAARRAHGVVSVKGSGTP